MFPLLYRIQFFPDRQVSLPEFSHCFSFMQTPSMQSRSLRHSDFFLHSLTIIQTPSEQYSFGCWQCVSREQLGYIHLSSMHCWDLLLQSFLQFVRQAHSSLPTNTQSDPTPQELFSLQLHLSLHWPFQHIWSFPHCSLTHIIEGL